jgi:hypothetical protein
MNTILIGAHGAQGGAPSRCRIGRRTSSSAPRAAQRRPHRLRRSPEIRPPPDPFRSSAPTRSASSARVVIDPVVRPEIAAETRCQVRPEPPDLETAHVVFLGIANSMPSAIRKAQGRLHHRASAPLWATGRGSLGHGPVNLTRFPDRLRERPPRTRSSAGLIPRLPGPPPRHGRRRPPPAVRHEHRRPLHESTRRAASFEGAQARFRHDQAPTRM